MIHLGMERTVGIESAQPEKRQMADLLHLGNVVEAGDFRLDLSGRSASVRGKELGLTSTEFDVLLFLANHPTNVVTASTTLITNWEGRQIRKVEFLHILQTLRQKIAASSGTNSYLDTETMVICRFNPSGSRRL